jgi:transposase
MATWAEMPRSPGHAFYDRLQDLLREASFDAFVEQVCKPYYAAKMGAPSLPPGRYFRMHMIGYFEGIDSERGIAWRCADSFSLRDFLRLSNRDKVPDHSWLSRTRSRLPHEAHEKVFGFVLKLVAERGLLKGERIGVDGSMMEANAALRTIVRRQRRELSRDADADGEGERRRDADGRGSGALRPQAQGQDAVERRLEEPDRPGSEDRQDEGRDNASGSHGRVRVKRELWGNGRHLRQRLDHEASQRWSRARRK